MWEGRELPKEVRKEEKKGLTGWHKGLSLWIKNYLFLLYFLTG